MSTAKYFVRPDGSLAGVFLRGEGPLAREAKVKCSSVVGGVVVKVLDDKVVIDFGANRKGIADDAGQFRRKDFVHGFQVVGVTPSGTVLLKVKEQTPNDVINLIDRDWGKCLGLYIHGSTIFSNKAPQDVDLLAVVAEPTLRSVAGGRASQFKCSHYEVSVYTKSSWMRKLAEMDLTMVTCASLPEHFVLHELDPELRSVKLKPIALHDSVAAYAEFTWAKACYMLQGARDTYRASKNLYFVFRVLELGGQLLEHGRILDFQAANHWWEHVDGIFRELQIGSKDWAVIEAVLAGDARAAILQLRSKLVRHVSDALSGRLPEPIRKQVAGHLVAVPPADTHGLLGPDDVCSLCKDPCAAESSCELARCRHRFHRTCIAAKVSDPKFSRAGNAVPRCCVCLQRMELPLNGERIVSENYRFGGYPATLLLPGEERDSEEVEQALEAPAGSDVTGRTYTAAFLLRNL